jgi:hypothetical protein
VTCKYTNNLLFICYGSVARQAFEAETSITTWQAMHKNFSNAPALNAVTDAIDEFGIRNYPLSVV